MHPKLRSFFRGFVLVVVFTFVIGPFGFGGPGLEFNLKNLAWLSAVSLAVGFFGWNLEGRGKTGRSLWGLNVCVGALAASIGLLLAQMQMETDEYLRTHLQETIQNVGRFGLNYMWLAILHLIYQVSLIKPKKHTTADSTASEAIS